MKAAHSLLAITLTSAVSSAFLVTIESGTAVAEARHHFPGEGSHKPKSPGASARGAVNNAEITGTRSNPNTSDTGSLGKNEDGGRLDHVVHPGNDGTEAIKSGIVADGPGHNTKKPADTGKQITTIFRPHLSKDERHLSGPGTIERNAVGFVIHNNGSAKADFDPKVSGKADVVAPSLPSPTATKTTVTPAIGRHNNDADGPAKNGPMINGTSVGRSGASLASVGGSTKNIAGTLSGNSFKPRHP